MSLSRNAKCEELDTKATVTRLLSWEMSRICDLVESRIVMTQGWEKGGEDAVRSPLGMMEAVWNCTVVTSV